MKTGFATSAALATTLLATTLLAGAPTYAREHMSKDRMGEPREHKLSPADQRFLQDAAMDNLTEVNYGTLAVSHGSTPAVREFGRWMVSTHSFANRELASLAERLHGETPPLKTDAEVSDEMGKLQNLHGADFDKAFLEAMAKGHDRDKKLVGDEAKDGHASLVKTFAANFLPTVDEHYAQVKLLMADAAGSGQADAAKNADMKAAAGGMGGTPEGNNGQAKAVQRQQSGK